MSKAKPDGISLPITEMTDDWMDDDMAIGSIESEDEEGSAEKPISYAQVASQAVPTKDSEPKVDAQNKSDSRPGSNNKTLVINVEEKSEDEVEDRNDGGFVEVASRKTKRERKLSKRYSQVSDDLENETVVQKPTESEKTQLSNNLANDSFWSNKYLFDDAEAKYYAQRSLLPDTSTTADGQGKKRKDGDDDGMDKSKMMTDKGIQKVMDIYKLMTDKSVHKILRKSQIDKKILRRDDGH